jgi:DNA-binding CsgD family transcriptional regulator
VARTERAELAPVIEVPRSDGTSVSVALLPLRRRNELGVRATDAARVLALVHHPTRVIRIDRLLIAEQHGLTATEAELAAQLAEGRTLTELANARGTSEQTARTHLKRILDKTETRRQADLVRLLLTGPAVHALR